MAYSEACRQAQFHLLCVNSPTSPTCADQPYVSALTASGAYSGTGGAWSFVSGTLPDGLTFAGGTAPTTIISGTPTVPGVYTFTVRYSLTNGDFIQKDTGIRVLEITTTSLPDADGSPYSETLTEVGGEITSWGIVSGSLPPGITLTGDTISGTATTDGVYPFTIGLYDGGALVCTKDLSITVSSCAYDNTDLLIDWTPSSYDLQNNTGIFISTTSGITEITGEFTTWNYSPPLLPNQFTASLSVLAMPDLVSVSYPNLTSTGSNTFSTCSISLNPKLTSVSAPVWSEADGIDITYNPLLTSINLSSLTTMHFVYGILSIQFNDILQSVSLPSLQTVYQLYVADNPALENVSVPSLVGLGPFSVHVLSFVNNALNQSSVDAILATVAGFGPTMVDLHLEGGTNSAPSAAGLANAALITANGGTVTTN